MNVSEFVNKWRKVELTERSASQQHFLDLCEVFNHPKPAFADPTGETFTFEKGAAKHGGIPSERYAKQTTTNGVLNTGGYSAAQSPNIIEPPRNIPLRGG